MKLTLILLAAMLAMTGCGVRDADPETNAVPDAVQMVQTESDSGDPVEETDVVYADNPTVQAMFAHEYTGEWDEYAVSDSVYAERVVFLTDGAVKDFCLMALKLEEITDYGKISFASEVLYHHGDLTPERGLAVTMNLPETIPYYGISYTDGTGEERMFSVNLSGLDGSVYLSEIGGMD